MQSNCIDVCVCVCVDGCSLWIISIFQNNRIFFFILQMKISCTQHTYFQLICVPELGQYSIYINILVEGIEREGEIVLDGNVCICGTQYIRPHPWTHECQTHRKITSIETKGWNYWMKIRVYQLVAHIWSPSTGKEFIFKRKIIIIIIVKINGTKRAHQYIYTVKRWSNRCWFCYIADAVVFNQRDFFAMHFLGYLSLSLSHSWFTFLG